MLKVRKYRVRQGDNLSKLAQEFGVTLKSLVDVNHIEDTRLIWVGQELNMGAESGWLHVQVELGATTRTGYISQELLEYDHVVSLSLREALVVLKRAETAFRSNAKGGNSTEKAAWMTLARETVQATGKYRVDQNTYTVSFASSKERIKIDTIEDFILFVEEVERQYPEAGPHQVAAEIRQVWFADANWEMLSAGTGINQGSTFVDIESKPNPIAVRFDMGDLSPSAKDLANGKKNKRLLTAMGSVDISHVLAGIDTRLNGFPSAYPKACLQQRGHDDDDAQLKYEILKTASGGDSRDFATWAGDLGQAYADFLVSRYVEHENRSSRLTMRRGPVVSRWPTRATFPKSSGMLKWRVQTRSCSSTAKAHCHRKESPTLCGLLSPHSGHPCGIERQEMQIGIQALRPHRRRHSSSVRQCQKRSVV